MTTKRTIAGVVIAALLGAAAALPALADDNQDAQSQANLGVNVSAQMMGGDHGDAQEQGDVQERNNNSREDMQQGDQQENERQATGTEDQMGRGGNEQEQNPGQGGEHASEAGLEHGQGVGLHGGVVFDRSSIENDNEASTTEGTTTEADVDSVKDENSLAAFAHASLRSEERLRAVELSSSTVNVQYDAPSKLFGFIPMNVPANVEVSGNGNVNVSYPWYSFLFATNKAQLQNKIAEAVASSTAAQGSTTPALSVTQQAQVLNIVQSVFKSIFGF